MTTLTRDRAINGLPMYSEDGNTIVEVFFDPVEMVESAENILKSIRDSCRHAVVKKEIVELFIVEDGNGRLLFFPSTYAYTSSCLILLC